ncbi:diphthine synthase-like protein [Peziza echinospora]|nr:diphthine synthase-like protein [Peziza echinospora]
MLYLIGLGLNNEKDISVAGLEIVRKCETVYLEHYTAILMVDKEKLEEFYGRPVHLADRDLVESTFSTTGAPLPSPLLTSSLTSDIALLIVGDPLSATTHTDLLLRARTLNIPTRVLPNASIMNAIGCAGLSLYNFGQTVSMVFFTPSWRPTSFYPRIRENVALGLHTLVLLDIKVKEMDYEAIALGRVRRGQAGYGEPRYMTVNECARQMLEVEEEGLLEGEGGAYSADETLAIGVARVGSEGQRIVAGTLGEMRDVELGGPLHSLVVVGRRCHDLERDFIRDFAVDVATFDNAWEKGYAAKKEA